jgi:hypothetical protein
VGCGSPRQSPCPAGLSGRGTSHGWCTSLPLRRANSTPAGNEAATHSDRARGYQSIFEYDTKSLGRSDMCHILAVDAHDDDTIHGLTATQRCRGARLGRISGCSCRLVLTRPRYTEEGVCLDQLGRAVLRCAGAVKSTRLSLGLLRTSCTQEEGTWAMSKPSADDYRDCGGITPTPWSSSRPPTRCSASSAIHLEP